MNIWTERNTIKNETKPKKEPHVLKMTGENYANSRCIKIATMSKYHLQTQKRIHREMLEIDEYGLKKNQQRKSSTKKTT